MFGGLRFHKQKCGIYFSKEVKGGQLETIHLFKFDFFKKRIRIFHIKKFSKLKTLWLKFWTFFTCFCYYSVNAIISHVLTFEFILNVLLKIQIGNSAKAALGSKHFSPETRSYSNEESVAYYRVNPVVLFENWITNE